MAKFLTLNTHSWMEEEQETKLNQLVERNLQEKYDVICLQEVNQLKESEQVVQTPFYQAVEGAIAIHQDHFALCLVEKLAKAGLDYHWSWAYNHIGFDIYNEGVAILSRNPLSPREVLVSEVNDPRDYHTRKVLIAETEVEGQLMTIASCHLSWWDKGFPEEWEQLEAELLKVSSPVVLMGDFNNPTNQEGYQVIMGSPLNLQDSHKVADHVFGDHSIVADIDGWEDNKEAFKVDHVFTSKDFIIRSSKIIFEGGDAPVVSDHYGLEVTLGWR